MALLKSDYAKGIRQMPISQGSEIISIRIEHNLSAAPAVGDILELGLLPEDHMMVDVIMDADDLDTNGVPTITLDAGVLNAAKTDLDVSADSGGGKWITASTVAQAGGLVRPTTKEVTRVVPKSDSRRSVGVRVAAAAATFAAGKIGLTMLYRAASYGA